jgi:hypothetical protein
METVSIQALQPPPHRNGNTLARMPRWRPRRGDPRPRMVHPQGKSVVRDHAGHCKQPLGLESGNARTLAEHEPVDVGSRQFHGIIRPQPDPVPGKAEIEGEFGKSGDIRSGNRHRQFLLQLPHQRNSWCLAGFDGATKTPPMVRIEDGWIGVSKLHHVATVRQLQECSDCMGRAQRGPGAEKCTRGL